MKQYEQVEDYIIKTLLKYKIFRTTFYELTDKDTNKREVDNLYKVFCKCGELKTD